MFGLSLTRPSKQAENVVTCQILAANGGRLEDQTAVEDYHSNAVMSHAHQMGFRLNKPTRVFRHMRHGLAPMKVRSVYVYNRTQQPPGQDLATAIQLEALFLAQMSGVDQSDDPEANAARLVRIIEVAGGVLLLGIALAVKAFALPDAPDAAAAVAQLLGGMLA